MRYLLKNFMILLCISVISTQSLSSVLLKASSMFNPRNWAAIEQALWGKVYAPYSNGKLSKLHDREAIGTPEAQQLLATQEFPYHASEIRIFDTVFDEYEDFLSSSQAHQSLRLANKYRVNGVEVEQEDGMASQTPALLAPTNTRSSHGVKVAYLLAGKSPLPGISTRGKISLLSNANPLIDDDVSQYLEWPGVINLSKATFTEYIGDLAPVSDKTLFVIAVGNMFPQKTMSALLASRALEQGGMAKLIPVGAIHPDGVVGDYSVADRSVVITAPGEHIFSFNGEKKEKFNATSAATPFVSGVLADVRSILPQLTQDNAIRLLQSTAIKTATNEVSKLNGAGVVNHYKILRVALRLAKDDYDGELMPDNLATYLDFSHEVADLMDASNDVTEFFLNLRRAFFLDPNNNDLRIQLASAYRLMGLGQQSVFYDAPAEAILYPQVEKKLNKRAKHGKAKFYGKDKKIAVNILNKFDSLKFRLRLAEDNNAVSQLKGAINAEKRMVKEIVANERWPDIFTDIEINEKLAAEGLPAVVDNIQLYRKGLGLDDVEERKLNAQSSL